jgi:hypothetical protein
MLQRAKVSVPQIDCLQGGGIYTEVAFQSAINFMSKNYCKGSTELELCLAEAASRIYHSQARLDHELSIYLTEEKDKFGKCGFVLTRRFEKKAFIISQGIFNGHLKTRYELSTSELVKYSFIIDKFESRLRYEYLKSLKKERRTAVIYGFIFFLSLILFILLLVYIICIITK